MTADNPTYDKLRALIVGVYDDSWRGEYPMPPARNDARERLVDKIMVEIWPVIEQELITHRLEAFQEGAALGVQWGGCPMCGRVLGASNGVPTCDNCGYKEGDA